jgi:hypothetical protein
MEVDKNVNASLTVGDVMKKDVNFHSLSATSSLNDAITSLHKHSIT